LGDGSTDHALLPIRIKHFTKRIVYIAAGESHAAAVTEDGELYTWGCGSSLGINQGGLGHGDSKHQYKPKLVEALKGVKIEQVSCGGTHTGCVTSENDCFMFGRGDWGRLGLGNTASQSLPQKIGGQFEKQVKKVSCGENYSALISKQNRLYVFGKNEHLQLGIVGTANLVSGGQFDGESSPVLLPIGVKDENQLEQAGFTGDAIADAACGDNLTCCATMNGEGYIWGKSYVVGPTNPTKLPKNIVSVSSGKNHVAFLSKDGVMYTSGASNYGQTGTAPGTFMSSSQEIHSLQDKIPGKVLQVACGNAYTMALVDVPEVTKKQ